MDKEKKLSDITHPKLQIKQVDRDGYSLNYAQVGTGEPILFLHGANIGWGQWYKTIPSLCDQYSVYALDFPGAGGSSSISYTDFDFVRDLVVPTEAFILSQIERPIVIVGHSIGSWVAAMVALRGNVSVKKIIFTHPVGFTNQMPFFQRLLSVYPFAQLIARGPMSATPEHLTTFLRDGFLDSSKAENVFIEYYIESVARSHSHPILFLHTLGKQFHLRKELYIREKIENIRIPIYTIGGAADRLVKPGSLKNISAIPSDRTVIIEGAAHVSFLESPDIFNTHLHTMIERVI